MRGFPITIYPSGNRAFTLDYRIAGRQRRMTIGRWLEWKTVAARERAKELRRDMDEGIDPLSLRETSREAPRVPVGQRRRFAGDDRQPKRHEVENFLAGLDFNAQR